MKYRCEVGGWVLLVAAVTVPLGAACWHLAPPWDAITAMVLATGAVLGLILKLDQLKRRHRRWPYR